MADAEGAADHDRAAWVAGRLAAGLAAGTKLSSWRRSLLLLVGPVVIAPRGARSSRHGGVRAPDRADRRLLVRSQPRSRSGTPSRTRVGGRSGCPRPSGCSSCGRAFRSPTTGPTWRLVELVFPRAHEALGSLWPLVLIASVGGGVYALWRGREPLLRALGGVAVLTALGLLWSPRLRRPGSRARPIAFVWNVRYLAPAAAIGLAILPLLPAFRATPRAGQVELLTSAGSRLFAATAITLVQWSARHPRKGASRPGSRARASLSDPAAPLGRTLGADTWAPLARAAGIDRGRRGIGARRGGRRCGPAPLPRAPLRGSEPAAQPRRRGRGGRTTCATTRRRLRGPRRLQPVPVLGIRPLEPRPVAGTEGPAPARTSGSRCAETWRQGRRRRVHLRGDAFMTRSTAGR